MIKLVNILKELLEKDLSEGPKAPITVIRDKVLDRLLAKGFEARVGKDKDRIFVPDLANKPREFKKAMEGVKDVELVDIDPIKPPSGSSSKFYAYTFSDGTNEYTIVIAAGVQPGEAHEKKEISSLQEQLKQAIQDAGGSIKIKIGSLDPYEIKQGIVTKVKGLPMADLTIDDTIFIQLKDLRFQQLSGVIKVSKYSGIDASGIAEIDSFVEDVKNLTGGVLKSTQNLRRKVVSSNLAKLAIFGDPSVPFGVDHVQLVCKGTLHLEKIENSDLYTIKGSSDENFKTVTDSLEPSDKWWPYLYAKYSVEHNQRGIENCRLNFGTANFIPGAREI